MNVLARDRDGRDGDRETIEAHSDGAVTSHDDAIILDAFDELAVEIKREVRLIVAFTVVASDDGAEIDAAIFERFVDDALKLSKRGAGRTEDLKDGGELIVDAISAVEDIVRDAAAYRIFAIVRMVIIEVKADERAGAWEVQTG